MSAVTTLLPPQATYTSEPIYRLTVEQYHDLIERGKLTPDDPVELIEGVLVFKMPKNPPHETAIGLTADILTAALPLGWHLRMQASITLEDGEPEPDGTIVRGERRAYAARHPGPADTAVVLEIANTTLARDRGLKLRSYARAGIACYWIINLIDRQIEVHTQPQGSGDAARYLITETYQPTDSVPLILDGKFIAAIPVADLLPPI